MRFLLALIFLLVSSINLYADFVESEGEAMIYNGDIPSAKAIAISRAKWSALESIADMNVKVDTLITNSQLADEAVKIEYEAKFKKIKVLSEGRSGDRYVVKLLVEIDKLDARREVESLSKSTSIAVVIPSIVANKKYSYITPFSEKVVTELTKEGFEVRDISKELDPDIIKEINSAISKDNYEKLNFLTSKYFTTNILVGKISIRERSKNVGYTEMPFTIVDGSLDWRLIGKKGTRRVMLASGTYNDNGHGSNLDAAVTNLYKNMSSTTSHKLISDVTDEVLDNTRRKVVVVLSGPRNIRDFYDLLTDIESIPFVLDVVKEGIDTLIVNYPEKTYYLASFLTGGGKYTLEKIGKNEIVIRRN